MDILAQLKSLLTLVQAHGFIVTILSLIVLAIIVASLWYIFKYIPENRASSQTTKLLDMVKDTNTTFVATVQHLTDQNQANTNTFIAEIGKMNSKVDAHIDKLTEAASQMKETDQKVEHLRETVNTFIGMQCSEEIYHGDKISRQSRS